jgi:hypothetical protein
MHPSSRPLASEEQDNAAVIDESELALAWREFVGHGDCNLT